MSVPNTYKSLQIFETGGLDKLILHDSTLPALNDNSVLVKVNYAGINYIDTYFRSGLYPVPLPFKLGQEGAGTVVSTGSNVNRFKPGQKVAFMTPGSLSEYHVIDQAKVVAIPDNLTEIDAAVGMLQGLTAWTFLQEACQIKKGTAVLIYAASGGVGTLLVQMAKHLGAYVIGTVSNEQKAQLAKDNGADDIIYYTNNSIVDKVLELTNGKGVDVIFDGVGRDTFEDDFTIVARKGTIISFGNASGAVPPFSILRLTEKNVKLLRPSVMNYVSTAEEFEHYSSQLFDLISRGIVKLHVHDVYKFDIESLRQAQADITSRKTTGKLVVKVSDE